MVPVMGLVREMVPVMGLVWEMVRRSPKVVKQPGSGLNR
jgi:hypothetical protein